MKIFDGKFLWLHHQMQFRVIYQDMPFFVNKSYTLRNTVSGAFILIVSDYPVQK